MTTGKPIALVVRRPGTGPEPPQELAAPGSNLWRTIMAEWDVSNAADLAVLEDACHARDTADRLRRQIKATGDEIDLPGGSIKANPLIMAELAARSLTARLLGRLGVLDAEPKRPPGRPPSKSGGW
jgi:hypothetical protein